MNLRDYLHFERVKLKELASKVDISSTHLGNYIHHRTRVSKKVAKAIERETGGKVSVTQIMRDNPPKKKPIQK